MLDYYIDSVDPSKKLSMAVCLAAVMLIFSGTVLVHLELWAERCNLDVKRAALETDWDVSAATSKLQDASLKR